VVPPKIPRPRSFEDVAALLEALSGRIEVVADGQLAVSKQIGELAAEVARLQAGPMRPPAASYSDLDAEISEFKQTLKERVRDPKDARFTSDYARAMVKGAIADAKRDDKAKTWDTVKKTVGQIFIGVVVGVLISVLVAKFKACG